MRNKEKWNKWEPIILTNLTSEFHEDSICDNSNGFTIILQKNDTEKTTLNINWKKTPTSYKVTNETYMDQIFNDLRERDKTYAGGVFFKITDSEYLADLSYSSGTLSNYSSFQHFVVLTSDSIIDIIAEREPEVTLTKEALL